MLDSPVVAEFGTIQRSASRSSSSSSTTSGGSSTSRLRDMLRSRPRSGSSRELPPMTLGHKRSSSSLSAAEKGKGRSSPQLTDGWEQSDMALRCLNNTLFLHEQARALFTSQSVGGGQRVLQILALTATAPPELPFLAARLVFFCTLFESAWNKVAVEEQQAVETLTAATSALQAKLEVTAGGQELAAVGEVLKAFFNLSLYYPRLADADLRAREPKAVLGEAFHPRLAQMLEPTVRLVVTLADRPLAPPLTNAIAVLLNVPVKEYRSTWFKATGGTLKRFFTSRTSMPPILTALLAILERSIEYYFTEQDVDAPSVADVAKKEGVNVEDVLQPLLLLLRKLAADDTDARKLLRSHLLPADLDRSIGLDKRRDLTGTLVRLLSSAVHPRLMRASGELWLAVFQHNREYYVFFRGCPPLTLRRSATEMSTQLGYGPSIGFLMSVNLGGAVPKPRNDGVDPVTGAYARTNGPNPMADMTEAEKEAEAEKLFTLFDRMNKTGVIQVQNPMQNPDAQSRFQEISEQEERRIEDDDEEEERSALAELEKWRAERRRRRM